MITIDYVGRFGNNMFQYAYARLLAEQYGYALCSDMPQEALIHNTPNPTGANCVRDPITIGDIEQFLPYTPDLSERRHYIVKGFFQRAEYYAPHRERIRTFWDYTIPRQNQHDIAVHVRLTDYKTFGRLGAVIDPSWYVGILNKEQFDRVVIYTDDPNDADYLRPFKRFPIRIEHNNAAEDFQALGGYNKIIMSNSSYAWWAAFLGNPRTVYSFAPWYRYRWDVANTLADFPNAYKSHGRFYDIPRQHKKRSFIVCYMVNKEQNRAAHLAACVKNICDTFSGTDYEIIVAEQTDGEYFKRGQLFNLGYKYATGDTLIFQDVDIRHTCPTQFEHYIEQAGNRPVLPFYRVAQCDETEREVRVARIDIRPLGYGAINVFTRQQFEETCGYSNLYEGWGGEDTAMNVRAHFERIGHLSALHIEHGCQRTAPITTFFGEQTRRNSVLARSESCRDKHNDGYVQTVANVTGDTVDGDGVRRLQFAKITMPEDFLYWPLLDKETITIAPSNCWSLPIGMMTYERPDYYKATLASLCNSGANLSRLWILDDHSTDPAKVALLRQAHKKFILRVNNANVGPFRTMKTLIEMMYAETSRSDKWFVVTQDDVEFANGWQDAAVQIVDQLYRDGVDWGILSLYNGRFPTDRPYKLVANGHPGAVCWAVSRAFWRDYRSDNDIHTGARNLADFQICHWAEHNTKRQWAVAVSRYSLVQHMGMRSSLSDRNMADTISPYYVGAKR